MMKKTLMTVFAAVALTGSASAGIVDGIKTAGSYAAAPFVKTAGFAKSNRVASLSGTAGVAAVAYYLYATRQAKANAKLAQQARTRLNLSVAPTNESDASKYEEAAALWADRAQKAWKAAIVAGAVCGVTVASKVVSNHFNKKAWNNAEDAQRAAYDAENAEANAAVEAWHTGLEAVVIRAAQPAVEAREATDDSPAVEAREAIAAKTYEDVMAEYRGAAEGEDRDAMKAQLDRIKDAYTRNEGPCPDAPDAFAFDASAPKRSIFARLIAGFSQASLEQPDFAA